MFFQCDFSTPKKHWTATHLVYPWSYGYNSNSTNTLLFARPATQWSVPIQFPSRSQLQCTLHVCAHSTLSHPSTPNCHQPSRSFPDRSGSAISQGQETSCKLLSRAGLLPSTAQSLASLHVLQDHRCIFASQTDNCFKA